MIAPTKVFNNSFHGEAAAAIGGSPQQRFLNLLPLLQRALRYRFRQLRQDERAESVQEAIAIAWIMYARLAESGREHQACPTALARYAAARVRSGRRAVGAKGRHDVMSAFCRRRFGVQLERLEPHFKVTNAWQEILVDDRRATPADLAAMRVDFRSWLDSLTARKRQLAKMLSLGEPTHRVARAFGLSRGRISQLRKELKASWEHFQSEPGEVPVAPARAV
jgi:hypothetical protein